MSNFKCNSHIEPYSNDAAEFGNQRKAEQNVRGIDEPHAATQQTGLQSSINPHAIRRAISLQERGNDRSAFEMGGQVPLTDVLQSNFMSDRGA